MRTQGTHYPFTLIVKMPEKWLSSTCGKSNKHNLRIISKPHAYVQTMSKTPLKFQKNRYKTVGLGAKIKKNRSVAPPRKKNSIATMHQVYISGAWKTMFD